MAEYQRTLRAIQRAGPSLLPVGKHKHLKLANDVVIFVLLENATWKQCVRNQMQGTGEQVIIIFPMRDSGRPTGAGGSAVEGCTGCHLDFWHQSGALTKLHTNSAFTERPSATSWQLLFWWVDGRP